MLEYFGLERKDVEEGYTPNKSQISAVKTLAEKYTYDGDEKYKWVADNLDYILGPNHDGRGARRIEINSVIAKVDDNEKFWGYIKKSYLNLLQLETIIVSYRRHRDYHIITLKQYRTLILILQGISSPSWLRKAKDRIRA